MVWKSRVREVPDLGASLSPENTSLNRESSACSLIILWVWKDRHGGSHCNSRSGGLIPVFQSIQGYTQETLSGDKGAGDM